jgi:hypothetical protein
MEPVTLGVVFTALTGAVSTLFWLYVRELQRQVSKLESDKKELANELKTTALKAEETVKAEQEATRLELSELRKTNAALVAALSGSPSAKEAAS